MKTLDLGSIQIHKLVEIERMMFDGPWLFEGLTSDMIHANRGWLGPELLEKGTDRLVMSFHSYVIRTAHRTVLVDTCIGNHKQRSSMPGWHMLTSTAYLDGLKAIGLTPEDIDIVMCTHLHVDHVGWNTRLENGRWVPTFPNARYLLSRADYEYFDARHRQNPAQPVNRGSFADSVLPVMEHGQAVLVDAARSIDADLGRGIWLEDAPGHTIGNLNIFVKSGGRSACLCGDVLHHAIQCAHPELYNNADYDRAQATATRMALLNRCADTDILVLTGHFPDPTAGRIVGYGQNFRFQFES
jgi:glyoxylase-like metal-dependent hydrolase (beta-lactamase superfamily II)